MRELSLSEIEMVGGAGRWSNFKDSIKRDAFFSKSPGWGAAIGSIVGSGGGRIGTSIGTAVGHFIETRDYHRMGERYKEQVARDVREGRLYND